MEWRRHAGRVVWPLLALGVVCVAGFAVSTGLAVAGAWPWWAAATLNTLIAYVAFTPVHEAAHGNLAGEDAGVRWLESLVGWLGAALLLAPFSSLRRFHLLHHAETNHPQRDPDRWVAGSTWPAVALRCATLMLRYYALFFRSEAWRHKLRRTLPVQLVALFVVVEAVLAGYGPALLQLWVLPGLVAAALLAFVFDWLPHHPHERRDRFGVARILDIPWLHVVSLGHAYHLIHHLWPRVPCTRYRRLFREVRPRLEAEGVRIVSG